MANDYTIEDIPVLKHFAYLWSHAHKWTAGQQVEIPSPAIEGRTDHCVVFFPYGAGQDAGAFIVRNKGKYNEKKSKAIAEKMAALLGECELSPSSSCPSYIPDERSYLDGAPDKEGTWVFCTRHRTAPRRLSEALKTVKTVKSESKPEQPKRRIFGWKS